MSLAEQIENKINAEFSPSFLQIENESHKHRSGSGSSHFRLVIVSEKFLDLRLIARHRLVNNLLTEELAADVHALALHTFTAEEWQLRGEQAAQSPRCS